MGQARKMVNMAIHETSGVDHPAHEHEGWIVMKSASAESVEGLFGSLNKAEEAPVADNENKDGTPTVEEQLAAAEARAVAAETALAEATAEPAPVVEEEDGSLEKALEKMPAPIRAFLAKQKDDLAAAQATITKERDQRLDAEAITKSKDLFKAIAIDHDTVAPALRRVAALDADLAKSIETALSAADAQLAAGTTLTKEVGNGSTAGDGNSALERITKAADTLREADPKLSASQAFTKAVSDNPELYAAYNAEKAGK